MAVMKTSMNENIQVENEFAKQAKNNGAWFQIGEITQVEFYTLDHVQNEYNAFCKVILQD